MTCFKPGRVALAVVGAALALGLAACTDPEAEAKAKAEAVASAAKAKADNKRKRSIAHQVQCLNALRWQKDTLATAGIGSVDLYTAHFREEIEKALGNETLAAEPPRPALSRATLPDYLDRAYEEDVATKFAAGKDYDGDGTITSRERNNRGFSIVVACVQEVAEIGGKGPLAGDDKIKRMYEMQELRGALERKGG